jgi:hypothetical protein
MSSLTLDLLTSKAKVVIYFSWCTSLQSLKSVKQRVLKILSSHLSVYSYVQFDPLNFDFLTSKSIVVIYFSCASLQSLKCVKQRALKILSGQYIPMSSLTLDFWIFYLKINSCHLLFMMYNFTKFEVCQALGFSRNEGECIFIFPVWSLDLWYSKSIVVIYFSWCTSLQSLKSVKQTVLKISSGQYIPMSNLTPWPLLTSKSIGVIYYLRCTSVSSLKSVK